jgi:hypothetical protein
MILPVLSLIGAIEHSLAPTLILAQTVSLEFQGLGESGADSFFSSTGLTGL